MREFTEQPAAVVGAGTHDHGVRPKRRSPRAVFTAAAVVALAGLAWWAEAQEARQQEQDTARVLLANRWMAKDPTRAALVLLEVENPDETPYAIATMIEVLGQPLTRFIFPDGRFSVFGRATLAVFSPDGTKVLTAGPARALVWNTDGSGEPVVLNGAKNLVTAAFNADGTKVVTTGIEEFGRRALVWNTDGSGEPVVLNGAENTRTVAFNPDGTKIVAACGDGTARVWNTDGSGEPVVLNGAEDTRTVAFSPDGTKIVAACGDRTARVWNVDGPEGRNPGEPVLLRHPFGVESAAFNPAGTMVVTTWFRTAWVWNLDGPEGRTPGEPVVLRGHRNRILTAAFSPDGTKIVTASDDETARVWNVGVRPADGPEGRTPGEPVVLGGHGSSVMTAAFSPDGAKVVTASLDGTARVWNVDGPEGRTPGLPVVLRVNEPGVRSAAFHADGTTVLTVSTDSTARVWDMDWEPVVLQIGSGSSGGATINADGTKVLTAGGGAARVWNVDGSGVPVVLEHEESVWNAAFSPDGTKVLTTESGRTLRVWNVDGSGQPVVLRGHEGDVWRAAFNAEGTKVVTASKDKTARVWNVDGSGEPVVLRGHEGSLLSAMFNADGTKVVTASKDETARVWNVDGSGEPVVLRGHEALVRSAAFNADGTKVVTASRDETARVWNVDGSGEPVVLLGHGDPVSSAAFNADGTKILTLTGRLALVWNVGDPEGRAPGMPVVLRRGIHLGDFPSAAFNPDGTKVVTWSTRHPDAVRVWNADGSGVPLLLEGHAGGWVASVAFSGDGTKLLITSTDGTARVWTVAGASMQAAIRETTSTCLDPFFRMSSLEEPPSLAWKTHAECEISHHRCPTSWWSSFESKLRPHSLLEKLPRSEFVRFIVEASERYLGQLSKEARERWEECHPEEAEELASLRRGVTLYEHTDFRGRGETFHANDPNLLDNPIGNDTVSSVEVDPGCEVLLYQHGNYRGAVTTLTEDARTLKGTKVGDDSVSSIQVHCGRR